MSVSMTCPDCHHDCRFGENGDQTDVLTCTSCAKKFVAAGDGRLERVYLAMPIRRRFPMSAWATAAILLLNNVETLVGRMLSGMRRFLIELVPDWVGRQLVNLSRVAVKAIRVLTVFGAWFALSCLPMGLLLFGPHWISSSSLVVILILIWTGLTLAGSWWGLARARRNQMPPSGQ